MYGLVRVDTAALKQRLSEKAAALRDALLETMINRMRSESEAVNVSYNAFMTRISEKPKSEAELVALKDYIRDGQVTMNGLAQVRPRLLCALFPAVCLCARSLRLLA